MFKKIMISATTLTVLSTGLIASDDDISIKDVAKAVEFIINDNKVYHAKAQKELDSNRAEVSKLKLKIAELEKKVSNSTFAHKTQLFFGVSADKIDNFK